MQTSVEIAAAILLTVIGLSQLFRHRAWAEWITEICAQGQAGILRVRLPTLLAGVAIAIFHNVWTGIPALLTIFAWLLILKGVVTLFFPNTALRNMARVRPEHSRLLWIPGVIMLTLGLLLAWSLSSREPNHNNEPHSQAATHRRKVTDSHCPTGAGVSLSRPKSGRIANSRYRRFSC